MFFRCRFFTFFRNLRNSQMPPKSSLFGHFWDPFGSLRGSLVRLLVTKVPQRLQKVSQKRSNGAKASQKGPKKTNWLAFVENFAVFSEIFLFYLVLASIWLLLPPILAPIGSSWLLSPSICSCCLLLSPIASSLLLLSPIGS